MPLELVVPLPLVLLEVVVPPSGGGTQGPQVPSVLPTGSMHVSPAQQSASLVHLPQRGTHEPE